MNNSSNESFPCDAWKCKNKANIFRAELINGIIFRNQVCSEHEDDLMKVIEKAKQYGL